MLSIPPDIWKDMIEHAREFDPHECCGILAGNEDGTISQHYRITNILAKMSETEPVSYTHLTLPTNREV